MKMGFHTNTNTTPTKLNFHHKEPQCCSYNNINIKDNNKKKTNKININNDNKNNNKSNDQTKESQNNGVVTSS